MVAWVALVLLGAGFLVAASAPAVGRGDLSWPVVALLLAAPNMAMAWAAGLRPYVAVDGGRLVIQNPIRRHDLALADITEVEPTPSGLVLRLVDGRRVTAWAVSRSSVAQLTGRHTRADDVAAELRRRIAAAGVGDR